MPTWEEVDKSIQEQKLQQNKITKLSLDSDNYAYKDASLEEMIMQLYNYYINLSGSVEQLRKLVELKLGGVK